MLVTNKEDLKKYTTLNRRWQGIPTVEVTPQGRIFVAFYSGMDTETWGNFAVLVKSDDGGKTFSEPIAAVDVGSDARAFDPCLWISPDGKLRFFWAVMPNTHVECAVCENPDGEDLAWSEVFTLPGEVMLNKPIVVRDGRWIFPCANWHYNAFPQYPGKPGEGASLCVESRDEGRTYQIAGGAQVENKSFDEHMFLEKQNGDLEIYVRTYYGIAKATSTNGGHTFGPDDDSHLGGPNSRFYIGRLKSGRVLLVNHYKWHGRSNLTAMLSEDDGETYKGYLLIDGRSQVSYPDVIERDGKIYIVYDRERGAHYRKDVDYSKDAREILMAVVTEEEILNGKVERPEEEWKMVVSKLEHMVERV